MSYKTVCVCVLVHTRAHARVHACLLEGCLFKHMEARRIYYYSLGKESFTEPKACHLAILDNLTGQWTLKISLSPSLNTKVTVMFSFFTLVLGIRVVLFVQQVLLPTEPPT